MPGSQCPANAARMAAIAESGGARLSTCHLGRGPSPPPHEPESEHLATFWTLRGPSERNLTCSAFRVGTGLELRTEYERGDIVATELFRSESADERLAERADAWRLTLLTKGFREIAILR